MIHILFFLLFFLAPAFVYGQVLPLKKATFCPQWKPQAQFAGFYVAKEKGFYKSHGIELTLLQGGPAFSSSEFLADGKADFVTMWLSNAIQMRASGHGIINIGQILQRSALMLVAKKSRGINKLEDINGKKAGLWGQDFQIQPMALFKKYNLQVTVIPQSFSVNLFLRDGVDVVSAMWYNEYHTLLNAGINPDELTPFFFQDYGLNFPEDGIYVLEKTFNKDPALSCAFVKATIEGWSYAFAHPDEALDVILEYMSQANVPVNRVHQKWMLNRMKDLIFPLDNSGRIGMLESSDYQRVAGELKESGLIKEIPDYSSFFIGCEIRAEQ